MNTKKQKKTKWSRRDLILLFERLELYISAGLPIDKTLAIARQGMRKHFSENLLNVMKYVQAGGLLSRGLSQYINISSTITGLIEHGESSGELRGALLAARSLLEREDELRKKCLSALAYPVIIGLFAAVLTLGLVRGVMPQIIPMLKSLRVELPLLTRIVIFLSESLTSYGLHLLIIVFVASILVKVLYKRLPFVKKLSHYLLIHIPIMGGLAYRYSLVVFLRSAGALIESGRPVEMAYRSTSHSVTLIPLREFLLSKDGLVARGIPLSNILSHKNIPTHVSPLLCAGEASGTLGTSIIRSAGILDVDIEHSLKRLTALIEPIMMAAMGLVVGAIALSIMMPIYDISKVLQK